MNHRRLTTFIFALALLFSAIPLAAAQEATPLPNATPEAIRAFEIYPKGGMLGDYFQPEIEAGKTATETVVIANTGNVVFDGRTKAINAHTAVNGGFEAADSDDEPTGVTLWLDYPEQIYSLEPGKGVEIPLKITVPEGTEPGQYLTSLVLENAEPLAVEGSDQFKQVIRFPMPVFITVPGEVKPGFEIGDPQLLTDAGNTSITIPIINTGNIRVRPEGTVVIQDADGQDLFNAPVTMGSVFAHDSTTIGLALPTVLPAGDYTIAVDLKDPETGVAAKSDYAFSSDDIATPAPPSPVTIINASGTPQPSLDAIQFLDVAFTISNTGDPLENGRVTLKVSRDGEVVENYPLADSVSIKHGNTDIQTRYIPATGWESGTWSFELQLEQVDPGSGVAAVLASAPLEDVVAP